MDHDRHLLAPCVCRADLRPGAEMPVPQRGPGGSEVEVTSEEESVYWGYPRPPVRGDRGHVQDLDAGQKVAQLDGWDTPRWRGDATEMLAGPVIAAVQQRLQPDEVLIGLVHAYSFLGGEAKKPSCCQEGAKGLIPQLIAAGRG